VPFPISDVIRDGGASSRQNKGTITGAKAQQADLKKVDIWNASAEEKKAVKDAEDFFLKPFEEWRKNVGIGEMILIGHSLGGYLASSYCLQNPEKLIKLILLSPVGVPEVPPDKQRRFQERMDGDWRLRWAKSLWEGGTTPQQLVRNFGWIGASRWFTSSIVERRFKHTDFDAESKKSIAGYLHSITILPRSGEDCISTILKFGAWARVPLLNRIKSYLKIPTVFIYGKNDWMDPTTAHQFSVDSEMSKYVSKPYIIPKGVRVYEFQYTMCSVMSVSNKLRRGITCIWKTPRRVTRFCTKR